ncbi:hypothetical protein QYF36_010312 [Acer negundo]|nr:hypothetical protein QYF36_010312 [Acer negundo]
MEKELVFRNGTEYMTMLTTTIYEILTRIRNTSTRDSRRILTAQQQFAIPNELKNKRSTIEDEFPPASKLDSKLYGDQNSTITAKHIESNLDGLTVNHEELREEGHGDKKDEPCRWPKMKTYAQRADRFMYHHHLGGLCSPCSCQFRYKNHCNLQAFEEFGNKLAKIEENILAMNKGDTKEPRWSNDHAIHIAVSYNSYCLFKAT